MITKTLKMYLVLILVVAAWCALGLSTGCTAVTVRDQQGRVIVNGVVTPRAAARIVDSAVTGEIAAEAFQTQRAAIAADERVEVKAIENEARATDKAAELGKQCIAADRECEAGSGGGGAPFGLTRSGFARANRSNGSVFVRSRPANAIPRAEADALRRGATRAIKASSKALELSSGLKEGQ